MRLLSALIFLSALLLAADCGTVLAYAKDAQDCSKCHTLNLHEARKVVSGLIPDVKIIDVQASPLNGLWEIAIESKGKKSIVYLDFSKNILISGNMFSVDKKANLTQEGFYKYNRIDTALVPYKNALVLGDKNAKHKIAVFDDPD